MSQRANRRAANKNKTMVTENSESISNPEHGEVLPANLSDMSVRDLTEYIVSRYKDPVIEKLLSALMEKISKQCHCECDAEKRARSLVISGLPEPSEDLRASEKQMDLEGKVNQILDVLDVDCRPCEVFRMGRLNGDRPRVVKLVLPSRSYWATALANAHRLRKSSLASVFVRRSMTADERKRDYELRQEAKERNRNANGREWVVYKGELKRLQELPHRQQSGNSKVMAGGSRN
ncbi:hypothetical protein Aduo_004388 [Ancylostoma duodenale]